MGLAATPQTSGYAVPTSGLAERLFIATYFTCWYEVPAKAFNISVVHWWSADNQDLTGTSLTATKFVLPTSATSDDTKHEFNAFTSDGKVVEWIKFSYTPAGGSEHVSDSYNLKETIYVPPSITVIDPSRDAAIQQRPPVSLMDQGVPPSLLRRLRARFAR